MDCSFVPGLVTRAVYRAAPARETYTLLPQPRASAALSYTAFVPCIPDEHANAFARFARGPSLVRAAEGRGERAAMPR